VACFERALAALPHLPESQETLELAVDLHFDLATSRLPLGQLETGLQHLRTAEGLARMLGDQRRLGWVSAYMCDYLWVTGDSTGSRTFGLSGQAIAATIDDFQLQIAADFYLGVACFTLGDYRQAEDLCRKVMQSLAGDLSHKRFRLTEFPASGPRYYLALTLAERGEFDEGTTIGQEAIHLAEAADHQFSLVLACWSLAYLYGLRGELGPAARLLERGLAVSREWNLNVLSPRVTGSLGSVYSRSQRIPEGLSLLHQGLKEMEALGIGGYHSLLVADLGEACLLADQPEDALAAASRALTLARNRGERGHSVGAPPPRRHHRAPRPSRPGVSGGALQPSPRPGQRARDAPAPGPLPSRPGQVVPPHR